jgi:hypothetical protein
VKEEKGSTMRRGVEGPRGDVRSAGGKQVVRPLHPIAGSCTGESLAGIKPGRRSVEPFPPEELASRTERLLSFGIAMLFCCSFWAGVAWYVDWLLTYHVLLSVGIAVFFVCALAAAVGWGEEPRQ